MDIQKKIEQIKNQNIENTEIVSVSYEVGAFRHISGLPPFYRVAFVSRAGGGSLINSELWLPCEWNGIFIGLGNGGMAGYINHDTLAGHLRRGYAVAHTDMGTSRGRDSGIDNPDVWRDFGWRATHIMTEVSKSLIFTHYGRNADYSYFIGSSTGGQQALSEAQRYPLDYDGIIAGVPANNRIFLHTYFLWNHNHLRTPDGRVMFNSDEVNRITALAASYFGELNDGEKGDRFVTFPYQDENTVTDFIAYLAKKCPTFSREQLDALTAVYNGPKNPRTGKQIYNGMPIGSEKYGCGIIDCEAIESPHFYPFIWAFGDGYDGYGFDFDKDMDRLSEVLSPDLNANSPDLSAFMANGGKLIAFSGSADPCVPFPEAMRYCERVIDAMGGYDKTAEFFRYFLLPGRDHGGGGDGINAFFLSHMLELFCRC